MFSCICLPMWAVISERDHMRDVSLGRSRVQRGAFESHFLSDTSCLRLSVCFFLETLGEENCQSMSQRTKMGQSQHLNHVDGQGSRPILVKCLTWTKQSCVVLNLVLSMQEGQSWQGSYYCTQGRTKFSLDITEVKVVNGKEQIQADLTFTIAKKGIENVFFHTRGICLVQADMGVENITELLSTYIEGDIDLHSIFWCIVVTTPKRIPKVIQYESSLSFTDDSFTYKHSITQRHI